MNFYAYIPTATGQQPLGTFDQRLIKDLKTTRGAINRLKSVERWNKSAFVLQTYTHIYDESTYRTVYTHNPIK